MQNLAVPDGKLTTIPNNFALWHRGHSKSCVVNHGESGKAFRNKRTQFIKPAPSTQDKHAGQFVYLRVNPTISLRLIAPI
jgi:hypothetical protein